VDVLGHHNIANDDERITLWHLLQYPEKQVAAAWSAK
jgi:hypothetical protein